MTEPAAICSGSSDISPRLPRDTSTEFSLDLHLTSFLLLESGACVVVIAFVLFSVILLLLAIVVFLFIQRIVHLRSNSTGSGTLFLLSAIHKKERDESLRASVWQSSCLGREKSDTRGKTDCLMNLWLCSNLQEVVVC